MGILTLTGDLHNDGLTGPLKHSKYNRWLAKIQENIHARIPTVDYNTTKAASTAFDREEVFQGINHKKAVIFLMSNGCEWALSGAHGCTMCGHLAKQTRKNRLISAEDHIYQFEKEFKKINFKEYPLVNIFNNGSFLNDNEIAPHARMEILNVVNADPDIQMLVIESRPEFVTEDKIKELRRLVPGKWVEVAIGLELKDDYYRILCLNKGFTLKDFDKAAEIITRYLHLRTYVFLKPIFLTEKESIEQTVSTIEHAFSKGTDTISLEACTVQDFTLTKFLYDRGLYTTPWLWSIVEVVKRGHGFSRLKKHQKLVVGLFQFYPSPRTLPYNCPRCSDRVLEALRRYNRTLDPTLFDALECPCKEQWEKVLNEEPQPFEERLETLIRRLKTENPTEYDETS